MQKSEKRSTPGTLRFGVLVCSLVLPAPAQTVPVPQGAAGGSAIVPARTASAVPRAGGGTSAVPRHTTPMSAHAREHYQLLWGVDGLNVKSVESGQMIRFSYTVLDANKAKQLNDKKASPYLVDEQARVKLEIPTMEKVGQLRQSSPPEAGKAYWMVFSNKGGVVKPGDRVTVVIGRFQADGLYVH